MRLAEIIMKKTDTGFGMTQYDNENFILAGGFRSGSSGAGTTRLKYMIYDRKIIAKTNDTEQAEIGVVELFVDDKTGTIEGLVNIEIYPKFRKSGYGSRIVRDIKDTAQGDLTIYDIQKKAKKFWDKMGVEYTGKSIKSGILSTKESITEGLSPVLYHYTGISKALDIITQNQFKLAASAGTETEAGMQSGSRMYFLSTTRHKLGGYHLDNDLAGVMLNLDGRKLGQKYKGKPVDYWGAEWYGVDRKGYEKKEAEDRLYSTEPIIPNAKQYIQEIHLLFTAKGQQWHEKTAPKARRLLIAAKSTGIPIYFYEDAKAWLIQNKRKTVDPSKIEAIRSTSAKDIDQGKYYYNKKNEFSGWIELYYINEVDKLSPATDRQYRYVMYYPQDAVSQLSTEIHNNKSDPESGLASLMRIWRKLKIRTVKEYVKFLQKKWGKDEG